MINTPIYHYVTFLVLTVLTQNEKGGLKVGEYNSENYIHQSYELQCEEKIVSLIGNVDDKRFFIQEKKDCHGMDSIECNYHTFGILFTRALSIIPQYWSYDRQGEHILKIIVPSPFERDKFWKLIVKDVVRNDGYKRPVIKLGNQPLCRYNPSAYWKWKYEAKVFKNRVDEWVYKMNITIEKILGRSAIELYKLFCAWCREADINPIGKKIFNELIVLRFGLSSHQKKVRIKKGYARFFVMKDIYN